MKRINEVNQSECLSRWVTHALKEETQASNPTVSRNYKAQKRHASTPSSKATLRKFLAGGIVNKHPVEVVNGLPTLYQKYRDFQFESPFKNFNRYPPEFKACLALDRTAVEVFLQHGWDINKPYTTYGGGGHWIDHGTPLALLIDPVSWAHPKMPIEKQTAVADMCIFLINRGANPNDLCRLIRTFKETGHNGVEVIKTAIEHRGNLCGALKAALNLPIDPASGYRDGIIALLLSAGAKLDD